MDSFTDITGLASLTDHSVGRCRVDIADYSSSPTFNSGTAMGTLEGTPVVNLGRDIDDIVTGVPEGIIAAYGIKDKAGFKIAMQEFQIANLGKQLGLASGNYSDDTTPVSVKKWKFGGNQDVRYFSARISKKMPEGTYLVITIHKGYIKAELALNHAAGHNARDLEFVGMIDTTREMGDNLCEVKVTASSPWT